MEPRFVSISHAGRRGQNQDTIITDTIDSETGQLRVAAVLDGMGGMKAGDRASQLAADVFLRELREFLAATQSDDKVLRAALTRAVHRAHDAVHAEGRSDPAKRGMGTTLVAALVKDGRFVVANVGDSRAYLWDPREKSFRVLTRDHSLREEAVRLGAMTREEAEASPLGHALTRSIGSAAQPEIDLFPEPGGWHELPPGGALLLCSDGLQDGLDDMEIHDYLAGGPDPNTAVLNLVRGAYHGGSRDNISVVLLADADYRSTAEARPSPPPIEGENSFLKPAAAARQASRVDEIPAPRLRKQPDFAPWWLVAVAFLLLGLICAAIYFAAQPRSAPDVAPIMTPADVGLPAAPATPAPTPAAIPTPPHNDPFAPGKAVTATPPGAQSP